jgi:hypothetical protein
LISDNTDLRTRKILSDKEGHYRMMKGLILQEDNNNFSPVLPAFFEKESHYVAEAGLKLEVLLP